MSANELPPGSHLIRVTPGEKKIHSRESETLLTLLAENSIMLRSDCGGKGVCQKCLVNISESNDEKRLVTACTTYATSDMVVDIPATSLMSAHVIDKAPIALPPGFTSEFPASSTSPCSPGIAVDLGTTTIAIYLVDKANGTPLSSIAVKNPQSLYGDDVVSRIGYIGNDVERLERLQQLVIGAIQWGIEQLLEKQQILQADVEKCVVVGNPTMIHILLGFTPASIGVSPYAPSFYDAQTRKGHELSETLGAISMQTLPQISGFLGGDILAAAIACELSEQPEGTLLIDLGTNGELIIKSSNGYIATSCATGPAFEGATLSCGIQAIPGAIDSIGLDMDQNPTFTMVRNGRKVLTKPVGICGSGIISGIAALLKAGIIQPSGAFNSTLANKHLTESDGLKRFTLFSDENEELFINQKDIRHVQLGKGALITGIDYLTKAAGLQKPSRIIVAGAFGSHLDKTDLLTLGMLPDFDPDKIIIAGNAAGTGATMVLCDGKYLQQAQDIASHTTILNLADDMNFQMSFVERLTF